MNQRQKCKDEDGALKDNRINRTVLIKCDCVNLWGQTLKTILLLWQVAERRIERIIAEVWGEGKILKLFSIEVIAIVKGNK